MAPKNERKKAPKKPGAGKKRGKNQESTTDASGEPQDGAPPGSNVQPFPKPSVIQPGVQVG